jgi:hypothetical protein
MQERSSWAICFLRERCHSAFGLTIAQTPREQLEMFEEGPPTSDGLQVYGINLSDYVGEQPSFIVANEYRLILAMSGSMKGPPSENDSGQHL